MRGQSEAIGIAVIMALTIGGIVAYTILAEPEPERIRSETVIAENFAFVLLQSDYDTGDCTDRMTRILDSYLNRLDPCDFRITLDETAVGENISRAITHVTRQTLDVWGLDYELILSDASGVRYAERCPGFGRSGVAVYTFGSPERTLEFAICS